MTTWKDESRQIFSIYSLLVLKDKLLVSLEAHIKTYAPSPCAYTLDWLLWDFPSTIFFASKRKLKKFFLSFSKETRGGPQVVLLSWFAFLAPLTSALEEFPTHAWSTVGQIWYFNRTGELQGEAASDQLHELPPDQPEGLYSGSIPVNGEGGGRQKRDC